MGPLIKMMGALRLGREQHSESPERLVEPGADRDRHRAGSAGLVSGSDPVVGPHQVLCSEGRHSAAAAGGDHNKVRRSADPQPGSSGLSSFQQM